MKYNVLCLQLIPEDPSNTIVEENSHQSIDLDKVCPVLTLFNDFFPIGRVTMVSTQAYFFTSNPPKLIYPQIKYI